MLGRFYISLRITPNSLMTLSASYKAHAIVVFLGICRSHYKETLISVPDLHGRLVHTFSVFNDSQQLFNTLIETPVHNLSIIIRSGSAHSCLMLSATRSNIQGGINTAWLLSHILLSLIPRVSFFFFFHCNLSSGCY